jgi:hypothetical protein
VRRTGSGQRLVHKDGRPFTAQETDLPGSAANDDMHATASELAAAPEPLAELFMPSIRTVAEQMTDHPPRRRHPKPNGTHAASAAGIRPKDRRAPLTRQLAAGRCRSGR